MTQIRFRKDQIANYTAIYVDGNTSRFFMDPSRPMTKPLFPEFMDIGITSICHGGCPYCYQNSLSQGRHGDIDDIDRLFSWMDQNQRPFQVAIGGGEPMEHPQFIQILGKLRSYDISPNYTTNGQLLTPEIVAATADLCDGVAVSIHEHLPWQAPMVALAKAGVKVNLHYVLSGDPISIKKALLYYHAYQDFYYKFVLLPYTPVGRAKEKELNYQNVVDTFGKLPDVGFGAGFYPALQKSKTEVSLYEPEMFSTYVDLAKRAVKPSSFDQGEGQSLEAWIAERKNQ